jgi:hypothetical protein
MLTEVVTLPFRPIPFLLLLVPVSSFLGGIRLDFHLMCLYLRSADQTVEVGVGVEGGGVQDRS